MIDSASATVASVLKATPPAASAARAVLKHMRLLGTYELEWLRLPGAEDGLTATSVSHLIGFLRSDETRPLLSLLALTLLSPDCRERDDTLVRIRSFFMNNAKRYRIQNGVKWSARDDNVWDAILDVYSRLDPALQGNTREAIEEFQRFILSPLNSGGESESSVVRYVERLSELASDIQRVADSAETADRIRDAVLAAPMPPIITYTSTLKTATFDDLYVRRSLADLDSQREIDTADLGENGGPFRIVVKGAPGAGKSTFVRNMRREFAKPSGGGQPALLVAVRDYSNASRRQSIAKYLHENTQSSLSLDLDYRAFEDGLILGQMVVIFDGLDEITDTNLRVDMGQRLSTFAREYPALSILVTTRSMGYENAPLPERVFTTLTLNEYSLEQSQDYVERWFSFTNRGDLISAFDLEADTVADLKRNPLLLSLLCILYRERGSIPRRRRDIYSRCADLLFHTWDSHRHIDQPEELHLNGDRIMQEIARWVYNSPSAQSGLGQSVIEKCIGIYLRDAVGVEAGEARRRASEFLEFCATRAWLLANIGTSHGERVFGFTHRTFFEYFAAEAFVRQAASPEAVARQIAVAYERDSTSVLPELMLQAYDEKVERGAREAFKMICRATHSEALIIRLMEGVPLPLAAREVGFDSIWTAWQDGVVESDFLSLLDINPDARAQFVETMLSSKAKRQRLMRFLGAWSALELSGRAGRYGVIWNEVVEQCFDDWQLPKSSIYQNWALSVWLWRTDRFELELPLPATSLFRINTEFGEVVGLLWLAIERLSFDPELVDNPVVREICERAVVNGKRRTEKIPFHMCSRVGDTVTRRFATGEFMGQNKDRIADGVVLWAILYGVALLEESGMATQRILGALANAFGSDVLILVNCRAASGGMDAFLTVEEQRAAQLRLREFPVWLRGWARGARSFSEPFGGSSE